MGVIYERASETAKKVRNALAKAFPELPKRHFSVKSYSYAGGSSISVHWDDYPSYQEVNKICRQFASSTFDGMQDLQIHTGYEYEGVKYSGADYVSASKHYSEEMEEKVQAYFDVHYEKGYRPNNKTYDEIATMIYAKEKGFSLNDSSAEDNKVLTGTEVIHYIQQALKENWYGQFVPEYYNCRINKAASYTVGYAKQLIKQDLPNLFSHATIQICARWAEQQGFEVRISDDDLFRVSSENPLTPSQDIQEVLSKYLSLFIEEFGDCVRPLVFTSQDTHLLKQAIQEVESEYPQFRGKFANVNSERFITHKRLTAGATLREFKRAVLKEATLPNYMTVEQTAQDIERMKRLRSLIEQAKTQNQLLRDVFGNFRQLNGYISYVRKTKTGKALVVNTAEIYLLLPTGEKQTIESRSNSETPLKLVTVDLFHVLEEEFDIATANRYIALLQNAFDLRHKVGGH